MLKNSPSVGCVFTYTLATQLLEVQSLFLEQVAEAGCKRAVQFPLHTEGDVSNLSKNK